MTDQQKLSRRAMLGATVGVAAAGAVGFGDTVRAADPDDILVNPTAGTTLRSAAFLAQALPPVATGAVIATRSTREAVGYNSGVSNTLVPVFTGGLNAVYSSGGVVLCSLDAPLGSRIVRVDCYGARTAAGTQDWQILDIDPTTGIVVVSVPAQESPAFPAGVSVQATSFTGLDLPVGPGQLYFADLLGSAANNLFVSVVYQYVPSTRPFHPIVPVRVYDSRLAGFGGPLAAGSNRNVVVKDGIDEAGAVVEANVVPAGASAIVYNLTIADTQGQGFVSITPGGETSFTASVINWSASGQFAANASTVSIDPNRSVQVFAGGAGSTNFIIDITGYYL